jgi:alanine racemase
VKANAYGHGAIACGAAAVEAGAAGLAVVCVDEGEELRRGGINAPILVVGHADMSEAAWIVELGLTPTVDSMQLAMALSRFATARGVTQRVHIELESGLNRNGLAIDALVGLAEAVRTLPGIEIEGLYTHLAAAEEGDSAFTRAQQAALVEASRRLPWIRMRHISASASALLSPEMKMDAVRAGLAVYGYHPAPELHADEGLRKVLSLKSRIARVSEVREGETVGYGRAWTAQRPSRIALIMCGYADGMRRSLSNKAPVLVHGQRVPIAGRIAMDMCMADVTDVAGVAPDDEAVIIGAQGDERIDADEIASFAGTISWEILAGISARVPRVYMRDGQAVSMTTLNERAPVPLRETVR